MVVVVSNNPICREMLGMGSVLANLPYLQATTNGANNAALKNKKEEPAPEPTPLEKMLQNAGPVREDGSDKFFGLENVWPTPSIVSLFLSRIY